MPHKLVQHGVKATGDVHHNLAPSSLVKKALKRKEVISSKSGVPVVLTGKYTGRSPNDRFIVDSKGVHDHVHWGSVNKPLSEKNFEGLYKKVTAHLSGREELFIFDGFAGADEKYALHVRVVTEFAYQALFMNHMLRRPTKSELSRHDPQLTVLSAPGLKADPAEDGTASEAFIVLHLEKKLVLIGGTKYSGELKKAVFTVMNYMLPSKGVFPMHCSANTDDKGNVALFFGLSGTGKTTLSADTKRFLIGDDEHGWSENGIFNFEGGCYAKCIDLKRESEPQIWDAIRDTALVENVVMSEEGEFDFTDKKYTENTRVAYPLEHIENAILEGVGGHPSYVLFLTADAYGVLPPVAKLDEYGAMYHFMSGYTSKLAGTERGVTTPVATFSTCFGAPFMPRNPLEYAQLLQKYMKKYNTKVYLVNTGWMGGPYGVGHRISIKDTRAIVHAILDGKLDSKEYRRDARFSLSVPVAVDGVASDVLRPRESWKDASNYDRSAAKLAGLFVENFKKFSKTPKDIIAAGPQK